jgi:DNA sulfur modification protein DndC
MESLPVVQIDQSVRNEQTVFAERGFAATIETLCEEIRELYLWDEVPWVIGYSGGKDSSAILQLVWMAVRKLPLEQRSKPIHVISTDTLVEQPIVAAWVDASHARMREAAREQELPITPHRLTPAVEDSFWVNLIGKGYPAPRRTFRWCTSRMKINPSNDFIRNVVDAHGEAVLVLGTRKAESQLRAKNMERHERKQVRERLTLNASLPNSLVYTPIEDWTNDDVWMYLMQVKNPWGHNNKALNSMYQGASDGGECPLVVDTSTPSCGNSRFGCWVCTLVDKDRSMEAMIKNDEEKVWMTPLLELRNELGNFEAETERRDYRRMTGRVQFIREGDDDIVRGPYKPKYREYWLRRVLEAQVTVRRVGPEEFSEMELISTAEMAQIQKIWNEEKRGEHHPHALQRVFKDATGADCPVPSATDLPIRPDDWELLRELCGEDDELFHASVGLLVLEKGFRGMDRRAGIFKKIIEHLTMSQYGSEEDAVRIRSDEERQRVEAEAKYDVVESPVIQQKQKALELTAGSDATP